MVLSGSAVNDLLQIYHKIRLFGTSCVIMALVFGLWGGYN